MQTGVFTISLDFELFWGVHDATTMEKYGQNIKNVHIVVPRLLALFKQYNIHVTWATVGFLFYRNLNDLRNNLPQNKPLYDNPELSAYHYIHGLEGKLDPDYYFASQLITQIKNEPNQEIGSHTYSHIFCLEKGISEAALKEDIEKSIAIAAQSDIKTHSIVFPRNQYSETALTLCKNLGLSVFRGNERHPAYAKGKVEHEKKSTRLVRLIDSYINLTGHHVYEPEKENGMINIRASRFLRPYSPKFSAFDYLKLRRIKKAMTTAAIHKSVFHLWWHPHNFGSYTDKNFTFLEKILKHYVHLNKVYKFESLNMIEIGKRHE